MEEKLNIINSLLVTLDNISASGIENHERIMGLASGLQALRKMEITEIQKKKNKEEKSVKKDG